MAKAATTMCLLMTFCGLCLPMAEAGAQPPAGKKTTEAPAHKAADRRVDKSLGIVIERGAEIYNSGDHASCCRLFEGALLALKPMLDHRPALQKAIDKSLAVALRNPKLDERAFLLREIIDKISESVNPPDLTKIVIDPSWEPSQEERLLLDLTNKEREKEGLKLLRWSKKLFLAARSHSLNMARQDKMAHDLDEKSPGDRLKEIGYLSAGWGENVANRYSPAQAIAAWMDSEGHRANILNPRFREIGIGIAVNQRGTRFFTQVFAIPR